LVDFVPHTFENTTVCTHSNPTSTNNVWKIGCPPPSVDVHENRIYIILRGTFVYSVLYRCVFFHIYHVRVFPFASSLRYTTYVGLKTSHCLGLTFFCFSSSSSTILARQSRLVVTYIFIVRIVAISDENTSVIRLARCCTDTSFALTEIQQPVTVVSSWFLYGRLFVALARHHVCHFVSRFKRTAAENFATVVSKWSYSNI